MQSHIRNAETVPGTLAVRQEGDPTRFRMVLWRASTSEAWTLTGHERVDAGPLQQEALLGQSRLVALATLEDLRYAEDAWHRLAQLVHEREGKRGAASRLLNWKLLGRYCTRPLHLEPVATPDARLLRRRQSFRDDAF